VPDKHAANWASHTLAKHMLTTKRRCGAQCRHLQLKALALRQAPRCAKRRCSESDRDQRRLPSGIRRPLTPLVFQVQVKIPHQDKMDIASPSNYSGGRSRCDVRTERVASPLLMAVTRRSVGESLPIARSAVFRVKVLGRLFRQKHMRELVGALLVEALLLIEVVL